MVASYVVPTAEVKALPVGANSPAKAAFLSGQQNANALNKLGNLSGGKSRRKKRHSTAKTRHSTAKKRNSSAKKRHSAAKTRHSSKRKRGGAGVQIYSPRTPYPQQGTGSNSIETINKNLTSSMIQGQANAEYDNKVGKSGGSRRHSKSKKRVKSY